MSSRECLHNLRLCLDVETVLGSIWPDPVFRIFAVGGIRRNEGQSVGRGIFVRILLIHFGVRVRPPFIPEGRKSELRLRPRPASAACSSTTQVSSSSRP